MASEPSDNYRLERKNYGNSFAESLNELLQEKELIDVTLVADGHLFGVHRLVLSVFSPYFRQMFLQSPANLQAYVFLKDISQKTMQDLITFIYTGRVNVKQEDLNEFLQTADALKINGLFGDNATQTDTDDQKLSTLNELKYVEKQYQTSQINQIHSPTCHRIDEIFIPSPSCYDPTIVDDIKENVFGLEDFNDYDSNCSYYSDNYELFPEYVDDNNLQWNTEHLIEEITPNEPIAKRPKTIKYSSDSDYNIVANVQSIEGHEYLMLKNYKFGRHGRMSGPEKKQRWRCTRNRTSKCRAAVSTISVKVIDIIGNEQVEKDVYMMRVLKADHSHEV